jgi:transcriptional regulator with XRE-family HTH domain|nr:MAG TPA: Helix-turn-helix XRE-family like protein [Caudoviricetes sp.]
MEDVGLLIAKERVKNNLSRVKLAEKVGCSARSIEYWESGKRKISLENAEKILKVLNIKIIIGEGNIIYEQ